MEPPVFQTTVDTRQRRDEHTLVLLPHGNENNWNSDREDLQLEAEDKEGEAHQLMFHHRRSVSLLHVQF